MGRLLRTGVCVLLLAGACASGDDTQATRTSDNSQVAEQLPDLAARFVGAVFRVETEGCGWVGSGSGFAIDAHHVVTNHHVVANDSSPILRAQDGHSMTGRVIGSTERPDLAVIAVPDALATTVTWADTADVQPHEPLVVMGYPVPTRTFKISTGQVVGFQPPSTREAIIANNPIDKGNSGGPALRRDGTVAGVVTEMATKQDDGARVAIVFTSSTVRAAAQDFIDKPKDVLSSCGLGPDYVPPVPTDFDLPPIGSFPAPPVQPDPSAIHETATESTLVNPSPPTVAPTTPTTAVVCPSGTVAVQVDDATAVEDPDHAGTWKVHLAGIVSNGTTAPIAVQRVEARVPGDPVLPLTFLDDPTIASGASAPWTIDDTVQRPEGRPPNVTVWAWWGYSDERFGVCPSPDASDSKTTTVATDGTVPVNP